MLNCSAAEVGNAASGTALSNRLASGLLYFFMIGDKRVGISLQQVPGTALVDQGKKC